MGLYKNNNGVLEPIAGRGRAEYGASTIRTGTTTIANINANSYASSAITIDPMPDLDYNVILEFKSPISGLEAHVDYKTISGFRILLSNFRNDAITNIEIAYTAFKLYTDNEYNTLLSDVDDLKTVTSGTTNIEGITWKQIGKIVQVTVYSVNPSAADTLVTGLPTPASYTLGTLVKGGSTPVLGGYLQIQASKANLVATTGINLYGSVVYIAA